MHNSSVIRARYILSLLRVARHADANVAMRLTNALASEYRDPDSPAELLPFENDAIEAVKALALSLSSNEKTKSAFWERAIAAATEWLNAAN